MTLDELDRAMQLKNMIQHAEQNINQDEQIMIEGVGGWHLSIVEGMTDVYEEIQEIGNKIMRIQARACITKMETELMALGVTLCSS